MTAKKNLIIIGAGGHAKVLVDALQKAGRNIIGLVDSDSSRKGSTVLGVPVIGDDREIATFPSTDVALVNGIGSVRDLKPHRLVFEKFNKFGYTFETVVHPSAVIGAEVQLGEGTQVMAGAVIQAGAVIGANCIINTLASIDHDCVIGSHVHIAPKAVLSGGVSLGTESHVGTAATIIQSVRIGARCLIAAGATVIKDLDDDFFAAGVPAKAKRK